MTFDENDPEIIFPLCESMILLISHAFPTSMESDLLKFPRSTAHAPNLPQPLRDSLLHTLDECIGPLYISHKGAEWKKDKVVEMAEIGLIYVYYTHPAKSSVVALVSFKMVLEPLGKCLYLYEIHVLPDYQNRAWGSLLMSSFLLYSLLLNHHYGQSTLPQSLHFDTVATALTVFSDNLRALEWYTKLGFVVAPDSPKDRRLRNGKIVRPAFYILYRPHPIK